MSFGEKAVREIKKTVLVTAYFLVGFNLLVLLLVLLDPGFRDPATMFAGAVMAALVVGKVLVIVDGMMSRRLSR